MENFLLQRELTISCGRTERGKHMQLRIRLHDNKKAPLEERLAIAKEQGLYQGRQKMKIDRERFEGVVKEWRADKITAVEAMKQLDVKPNTFYRRVKEWGL